MNLVSKFIEIELESNIPHKCKFCGCGIRIMHGFENFDNELKNYCKNTNNNRVLNHIKECKVLIREQRLKKLLNNESKM